MHRPRLLCGVQPLRPSDNHRGQGGRALCLQASPSGGQQLHSIALPQQPPHCNVHKAAERHAFKLHLL